MDDVTAHSRQAMAKGSNSFRLASQFFDPRLREDVWRLYAWCRHCDDQIDGQDHGRETRAVSDEDGAERLNRLRRQTRMALAGGEVSEPAFIAFQSVALGHGLREKWPLEMLAGFEMDVSRRSYASVEETLEYCWAVAGVVGVMMASIMGVRDPAVLRRAQDLGLAFQITNICRDITEDAVAGRIYLPSDKLAGVGVAVTPGAILAVENYPAVFSVASDLLGLAEAYYRSSRVGLRFLPFRAALAIAAARGIYREIGRRLRRKGPAAIGERMTVPRTVMVWLALRGCLIALWSRFEAARPAPRPPLWSHV